MSLNVRHDETPGPDSHWRDIGVVMRLRIAEATLSFVAGGRSYVGTEVVEILEIVEEQPEP